MLHAREMRGPVSPEARRSPHKAFRNPAYPAGSPAREAPGAPSAPGAFFTRSPARVCLHRRHGRNHTHCPAEGLRTGGTPHTTAGLLCTGPPRVRGPGHRRAATARWPAAGPSCSQGSRRASTMSAGYTRRQPAGLKVQHQQGTGAHYQTPALQHQRQHTDCKPCAGPVNGTCKAPGGWSAADTMAPRLRSLCGQPGHGHPQRRRQTRGPSGVCTAPWRTSQVCNAGCVASASPLSSAWAKASGQACAATTRWGATGAVSCCTRAVTSCRSGTSSPAAGQACRAPPGVPREQRRRSPPGLGRRSRGEVRRTQRTGPRGIAGIETSASGARLRRDVGLFVSGTDTGTANGVGTAAVSAAPAGDVPPAPVARNNRLALQGSFGQHLPRGAAGLGEACSRSCRHIGEMAHNHPCARADSAAAGPASASHGLSAR